jgi:hypothetical protein
MLLAVCSLFAPAQGGSVTITSSDHDTTLFKSNTSNALGGGMGMFAGTDGGGASGDHRALVSFNLVGQVPSRVTITSVSLELTLATVAGSSGGSSSGDQTPREIDLHLVKTAWGEGTAGTGGTINGSGGGSASSAGDATWASSASPTAWATAGGGGDYLSTVSSSETVGNPGNTTTQYFWNSTPNAATPNPTIVSDVQSWVNDPSTNHGWELINTNETDAKTFRVFFTREAADGLRPELTVTWVPEPGAMTMLLLGALGIAPFAWRRKR